MCILLLLPGFAFGHHSRSAFDLDSRVEVEGRVTEVAWTNPHYYVSVRTIDETEWTFEGHSIPGLVRNGWSRNTLTVGGRVVVVANPNRTQGVLFGLLDSVTRQDGRTFYSFRRPPQDGIQLRTPVEPSTDFTGTWRLIRSLRDNLVGGFEAPGDWPLTEKGREEGARFDINDDPSLRCERRGMPRMLVWPYAQRWERTENGMRIELEHSDDVRTIHERNPPAPVAHDNGFSVASVVDGDYVVRSGNFPDKHWGTWRGISSGEQKTVVEKYELQDDGLRMKLTFTVSDPEYLTEPVMQTASFAKVADYEFAEEPPCDVFTATRHLQFETEE